MMNAREEVMEKPPCWYTFVTELMDYVSTFETKHRPMLYKYVVAVVFARRYDQHHVVKNNCCNLMQLTRFSITT
jgi:hypothetical protein